MSEHNDQSTTAGTKDCVDGRGEKVICNGKAQRTSENGSVSRDNLDCPDNSQVSGIDEVCDSLDTRWTRNEETVLNSKDPSCNSNTSDNTSSGDETEEGDFAANWYVPLPQDPSQSDDEAEDGEDWSKGASGLTQGQEEEEVSEDVEPHIRDVKPVSKMEDSKSFVDA